MISLHKATTEIHVLAKIIGGIIGILFLGYLIVKGGAIVKEWLYPTPPPPPTVTFGKIPRMEFPASVDGSKNSYTLNTLTGQFPSFPDRAAIYTFESKGQSLLAIERAREKMRRIGFNGPGSALNASVYQWSDPNPPFRKIVLDILDYNFTFTSNYLADEEITTGRNTPTAQDAVRLTNEFLTSISGIPGGLDTQKTKTTAYRIENNELVPATSISNTQIIRVDLYHADKNNLPLYYGNPPFSNMNFVVAGGQITPQIVMGNFFYHQITNESGTYPIITVQEAWEELKKGNAYIPNTLSNHTISIKEVKLGYFLDNKKQEYLMPIYVFEGDNNFFAYVWAIHPDWIAEKN